MSTNHYGPAGACDSPRLSGLGLGHHIDGQRERERDIESGWCDVRDRYSTEFGTYSMGWCCELAELDGWLVRCIFDWLVLWAG